MHPSPLAEGSPRAPPLARRSKPRPDPIVFPADHNASTVAAAVAVSAPHANYGTIPGCPQAVSGAVMRGKHPTSSHAQPSGAYHCGRRWAAALLVILVLGGILVAYGTVTRPTPRSPHASDCVTSFGVLLGMASGVPAYSNCRLNFTEGAGMHFVRVNREHVDTGTRWDSLEFVRRAWVLTRQLTFPPIGSPDELINLSAVTSVATGNSGSARPVRRFLNAPPPRVPPQMPRGAALTPRSRRVDLPEAGDVVVYNRNEHLPRGHVALVTKVQGPFSSMRVAARSAALVEFIDDPAAPARSPEDMLQAPPLPGGPEKADQAAANTSAVSAGLSGGCVFYAIYVAEQNWDNRPWASGALLASCGGPSADSTESDDTPRRSFSRVLVLYECMPTHRLHLQDTHNNEIIGWVRA